LRFDGDYMHGLNCNDSARQGQPPPDAGASGRPPTLPPELTRFVAALFLRNDLVLIRFVESWVEGGKKKSRVVYDQSGTQRASRFVPQDILWQRMCDVAEREKANVYFGAAPRFGKKGYDLAWQIRTIRVLWADLDRCTPEEAQKRCVAAGVPPPTIVVCSGQGVHLYWLLCEPYLIDDAGDPPQVLIDWIEQPDWKKKPRKYVIDEAGERHHLYRLDHKTGADSDAPDPLFPFGLSAKARHVQDVLGGIAKKVGGDHTHDLARLLRLVGTLNRKDERNGKEPVPCVLVECHPERRYPFADFERFAAESPERIKREAVAKVPLPTPRKLSVGRRDRLGELVTECAAAPPGQRSERDWHLVCWAIEKGVGREEVWQHVHEVGKFAEGGRRYFDHTWGKAEQHTREQLWEKARRPGRSAPDGRHHSNGAAAPAELGKPAVGDWGGALPPGDPCTDQANAIRLVTKFGEDFRHVHAWGQDLVWRGCRWEEDSTAAVERFAKMTARAIYQEAEAAGDRQTRGRLAEHAIRSESAGRLAAMVKLARSEPTVPVLPSELDSDPMLLNVSNGTIDLRTGELRLHDRGDYITKLAPVNYDPEARCPLWERFLARVMDGNADLVSYLQRIVGYCLTGDVSEQCLFFLHGTGANGKSTFLGALKDVLGDYATQAVSELLLAKHNDAHPTERADLAGRRFVCTIETDQGRRMAEALTKQLTGGDTIKARRLYQDLFEIRPTWKIFLAANHKPVITGTDFAIWRRVKMIPFAVTIPEEEKDKHLPEKLRAEWPGILRWAVEGCLDWQRHGLGAPEEVRQATDAYRAEQDTVGAFLAECCCTTPSATIRANKLFDAYVAWSGDKAATIKWFGQQLRERDLQSQRGHGGVFYWRGIGLPETEGGPRWTDI
jgi:putative DNA primase/helicase